MSNNPRQSWVLLMCLFNDLIFLPIFPLTSRINMINPAKEKHMV